jgi:ADP-ribosyl-[dinitrogen reductase] hydrolase
MITSSDRVLGCLYGGAIGDAWGGAWENRVGPVDFAVPATSEISDDTQLTLATCESVVGNGALDPEHLAAAYLRWFAAGRITGIGRSTLKAMRDLSAGVHWALAGNRGEYAAGNGAAMRIAPLAFLLDPANAADRTVIRDVCRITHHHDEAYVGALAVLVAIRTALDGTWPCENGLLRMVSGALPDSAVRDRILEILRLGISPSMVAARFGSTGYVVDTVPLALACAEFISREPLPEVVARAIRCGGDTDTVASITGQIAGAAAGGKEVLPHLMGIAERADILQVASEFAEFVDGRSQRAGR